MSVPAGDSGMPSGYTVSGGVLSLSGDALRAFLTAVLDRDVPFRFTARGSSMFPFIRDGDVITLGPVRPLHPASGRVARVGDVVAFRHPETDRLAIHRVVGRRSGALLVRGDNCAAPDGLVALEAVIGRVLRVEREGRIVALGRRPERLLIAWLARYGALVPLLSLLHRVGPASLRRRVSRALAPNHRRAT